MRYDAEELKKLALREGFTAAGELNLKAVVFMPEVRDMVPRGQVQRLRTQLALSACVRQHRGGDGARQKVFFRHAGADGRQDGGRFRFRNHRRNFQKTRGEFHIHDAHTERKIRRYSRHGRGHLRALQTVYISRRALPLSRRFVFFHGSLRAVGQRVCELSSLPYNYGKQTIAFTSCYLLK